MTTFSLPAPRLAGLVSALPALQQSNAALAERFGAETIAKIIAATGIETRPVATTETVGELGTAAARRLLDRLDWPAETIDLIVVVTQTPDYPMPATACVLQRSLGLGPHAAAFDLSLGCSGFVYGLSVVAALLAAGAARRALLVTGDITSRLIGADDRSLAPLFGDAVTATALEAGTDGAKIAFDLGTDGSGAPYLTCHAGGTVEPGAPRLFMDGTQVMAFSLKQVRPSIQRVMAEAGKAMTDVDHVVLHQANAMMLKVLGQKIGATPEQLVVAVKDYGNTSSASIPLALCDCLADAAGSKQLLLSGFGVGWSWASAWWETPAPGVCEVVRGDVSTARE
ncbi:MAG TPA: ketoacyl-ACP synthase III [Aliidongia sp.]|uniref:ketoacyl-ACP synthase III n=1 Tax=Aliidongia sp. TaxID=1914230 RepID=UPI002DDCC92B|nr:ketoacyl-ACP synthase III [Aliidongia sp.]HEV2673288.1 ketoacyl-ACP synthase III [Aliidongia sp.]